MINILKFPRLFLFALAMAIPLHSFMSEFAAQEINQPGDLVKQEGWQLVQENCTECHSSQIITQNSGTREVWKSRIIWMQETQGLGELTPALENSILDYLAKNYRQKTPSRRPALAAHLMPANPDSMAN